MSGFNPNPLSRAKWNSLDVVMYTYAEQHGCENKDEPTVTMVVERTTCYEYANGCSVKWCVVDSMGHDWSSSPTIDATDEMYVFFKTIIRSHSPKSIKIEL